MKSKLLILSLVMSTVLCAQEAKKLEYHFGATLGFGGDLVTKVTFTDGSSRSIYGNSGYGLYAGIYAPLIEGIAIKAMTGMKIGTISASNGDVFFSRIPVDLSLVKEFSSHRIMAGATYQLAVHYSCQLTGSCSQETDFDNALGAVIGYEYVTSALPLKGEKLVLGVNYTSISHKVTATGQTFDGSGVNLYFGAAY